MCACLFVYIVTALTRIWLSACFCLYMFNYKHTVYHTYIAPILHPVHVGIESSSLMTQEKNTGVLKKDLPECMSMSTSQKGCFVLHYLSEVLVNCHHPLLRQKVCPKWLVCCLQLQPCCCCHPLHPPLALQWSWWAFWLFNCLEESIKSVVSSEHNKEGTHCWTFDPTRKKKKKKFKGNQVEDTGPQWRKLGIQLDHNTSLTPTCVFSFLFVVRSSVL